MTNNSSFRITSTEVVKISVTTSYDNSLSQDFYLIRLDFKSSPLIKLTLSSSSINSYTKLVCVPPTPFQHFVEAPYSL